VLQHVNPEPAPIMTQTEKKVDENSTSNAIRHYEKKYAQAQQSSQHESGDIARKLGKCGFTI